MARPSRNTELDALADALYEIRSECLRLESSLASEIALIPDEYQPSARNLAHYLALRQHDLRDLQRQLHRLGLSSLGRLEAHALAGLDAVLIALQRLQSSRNKKRSLDKPGIGFADGPQLLSDHSAHLFGSPTGQTARIMVTMPSEAADRYDLVRDLVSAGMSVMRINCAHDDVHRWTRMAHHLRRAVRETGVPCRILVDLGGPKLRTGKIAGGACVLRWKPRRDVRGNTIAPAKILFRAPNMTDRPAAHFDAVFRLPQEFLDHVEKDDTLVIEDCRNKSRRLVVKGTGAAYVWAESGQSCYVEHGASLELWRKKAKIAETTISDLRHVEQPIVLHVGDTLIVTDESHAGQPSRLSPHGETLEAARIPCTLPEAFRDVRAGQRIAFDDGAIWGLVRSTTPEHLEVEITHTAPSGSKLGSDKGINLPDTDLQLSPLTEKDLKDLEFAVAEADLVGLSFVRKPDDVRQLQEELKKFGKRELGIVLKIETRPGFEELPRILLTTMRTPPVGIMLARGDLAVEMGFERMAEIQEEMLWLCEAAHVPAIWATQVLEGLTKKGIPSRAEVTDAAMSTRAECVMLNKGPYVVDAVRFLAGVQQRMLFHQEKKKAMLRRLSVSDLTPVEERTEKSLQAAAT